MLNETLRPEVSGHCRKKQDILSAMCLCAGCSGYVNRLGSCLCIVRVECNTHVIRRLRANESELAIGDALESLQHNKL